MSTIKRIKGSHCRDCKVFASKIDQPSIELIQELLDNKHNADNKVRIMPDVHLGHGIVMGN